MAKMEAIDLIINTAESAKSLKDVKNSLKEIKNAMLEAGEGTVEFNKLGKAAGELKDRVDDANEAIKATNPNKFQAIASFAGSAAGGVSAVTGAMSLLGVESDNVQKAMMRVQGAMAFSQGIAQLSEMPKAYNAIKTALGLTTAIQQTKNIVDAEAVVVTEGQVVATKQLEVAQKSQGLASKIAAGFQYALNLAMSLNPIGLIIAGVAILVGVLFALKDKFKPIQIAFDAVAEGVKFVIQGIKDAMDWLGLSSFADDEASEKKLKNINKIKDAQSEASDHEIRMAKAAGKDVEALEQKKRKDIIDSNKLAMAEILRHAVATNSYTDEQKKQYKELAVENKKMNEDIMEANIKHDTKLKEDAEKKKAEDNKKIADDLQKQKDAAKARYEARLSETKALTELNKSSNDEERIRLTTNEIKKLKIVEEMAERDLQIKFDKSTKDAEAVKSFNAVILNLREKLGFDIEAIEKKFQDATIKAEEEAELRLAKTSQEKLNIVFKRQQAELESQLKANSNNVKISAELNEQIRLNKEKHIFELENLDKADREKKFADLLSDQEKIITDSATTLEQKLSALDIENDAIIASTDMLLEDKIIKLEENEKRQVEITKKANLDKLNSGLDLAKQGLASIQAVTDVAFEAKLKKVKKGSKEEEKLMRQQFKLNKAMQLAGAIVDGTKAALTSLASAPVAIGVVPNPVGIAALAFTVATSLANIAKISATQFDTTSVGGGDTTKPSLEGGNMDAINTSPNGIQPSTQLDENGNVISNQNNNQQPIQAYMVESQATSVHNNVAMIESSMTFHAPALNPL